MDAESVGTHFATRSSVGYYYMESLRARCQGENNLHDVF
jgi:hypothetical protein